MLKSPRILNVAYGKQLKTASKITQKSVYLLMLALGGVQKAPKMCVIEPTWGFTWMCSTVLIIVGMQIQSRLWRIARNTPPRRMQSLVNLQRSLWKSTNTICREVTHTALQMRLCYDFLARWIKMDVEFMYAYVCMVNALTPSSS